MVKRLIVAMALAMALVWCGSAMAIDQSACARYEPDRIAKGDNVTCLGLLEYDDMFNQDGTIKASFQAIMDSADTHPNPGKVVLSFVPPAADLVSEDVGNTVFGFQIDNRAFAGDREADSRAKFKAYQNAKKIPQVWAMSVVDPFPFEPELDYTCCHTDEEGNPDNHEYDWLYYLEDCPFGEQEDYGYTYPVTVYHFDTEISQECIDSCDDVDWNWFPGDGSDCSVCFMDPPDCILGGAECIPPSYAGPTMRIVGDLATQAQITWVETGETAGVVSMEKETYWYRQWNQGDNFITNGYGPPASEEHATLFGGSFTPAPVGIQNYLVSFNGESFSFTQEIFSNTVMPVVAAKSYFDELVCAEKKGYKCTSGKKIKATLEQTEVDNVTAREITADDGSTLLLIQWAEPDRAMELVHDGKIRLRIYVGNGWDANTDPNNVDVEFVWLDVPLHAGSVVVPADMYDWIKTITKAKGKKLDVAGMYREQFEGYHNRGYIEGIKFDLP